MGSYFEDVYLKRINKDGKTQQDRIKTRKEREFDKLFLKKTEYLAKVYQVNDTAREVKCSLQPSSYSERQLLSHLLVSTSEKTFKTGDILRIKQKIKDEEQDKLWLVLFVEGNLTKGYQLFKVICLDSSINLTDEYGTTNFAIPVKFVNVSSQFVQDVFIHSATQLGYREPNGNRILITKDFDFIKKTQYFEYNGRGWEIYGIDNVSVENVAYITISEKMLREAEPIKSQDILVGEDTNFFLNGR